MKYLLLLLFTCFMLQVHAQQQPQKWNRQMQLKSCKIRISSGQFTASTFIEMEFYNSNDVELEGLYQFKLKPGQVIAAFQLELNGKYRDGTLEEKWKATNAYNTIVGKRIDPALLSMDHANAYSLRIYPVPAKGSRKVTFTIQQLLTVKNGRLHYELPLNIADTVQDFELSIHSATALRPQTEKGLIKASWFDGQGNDFVLKMSGHQLRINQPVAFSMPLSREPVICQSKLNNSNNSKHFAIRITSLPDSVLPIHAKRLTVFWDASGSGKDRDIEKEIRFLQQFIAFNSIQQLTLIPFNHRLLDTVIFQTKNTAPPMWKQYLRNLKYVGATQLGCISDKAGEAELLMLFSDGVNSYGGSKPAVQGAPIFCVNSAPVANRASLEAISGSSGGRFIDLAHSTILGALSKSNSIQNWLVDVTSTTGKTLIDQTFPMPVGSHILINGSKGSKSDTLLFHFGNGNHISSTQKIILQAETDCNEALIARITMLQQSDEIFKTVDWEKTLDIGLQENIVTPNTAYIVLERIEDYIRYNIEAPADLQKECEALQYVKSNTRLQRQQLKQQDDFTTLNAVVQTYNRQYKKLLGTRSEIAVNRKDVEEAKFKTTQQVAQVSTDAGSGASVNGIYGLTAGSSNLNEVVVTGYATMSKRSLTGSVTSVQSNELTGFQNISQALQGRVAGISITQASSPGAASNIIIRGASSLSGNNQPLFVLDGIAISGNMDNLIEVNNIQDVTVLRGADAFSLYGSQAANGAIVVRSKRGTFTNQYDYNRQYRLKDMADVEYMQEIKATSLQKLGEKYKQLEEQYANEPGFYFDMASHFFQMDRKSEAFEILMQAAEQGQGHLQSIHAIAYVLESWQMYKEAILVYEQLLQSNPTSILLRRDLAWLWYQAGNYQTCVDIFYQAIVLPTASQQSLSDKATMLYEMNQVIALHKNVLNISMIPAALLQDLHADLRIVLTSNVGRLVAMSVREPGGTIISQNNTTAGSILYRNDSWHYNGSTSVYQVGQAKPGKYRLFVNYYSYYAVDHVPSFIRIKTFKNFGKPNQSIEIENVVMDNQFGEIEIGSVDYKINKKE